MTRILVSLISEQTIPNILAINEIKPDELLFINTEKGENLKKVESILQTLCLLDNDYTNRSHEVEVKEDSVLDFDAQLEQWSRNKKGMEFIVNLTCGTKIMTLAAYDYFREYTTRFIYLPIGKNEYLTPFPKKSDIPNSPVQTRLSVHQYLSSCNVTIINQKKLNKNKERARKRKDLTFWIAKNYFQVKKLMSWLYKNLNDVKESKEHLFRACFSGLTGKHKELLKRGDFEVKGEIISKKMDKKERHFWKGGWLEQFCFNELEEIKGLDDLVLEIHIKGPQQNQNEFDVMFTNDNALYFIECKSLELPPGKKTDVLYKCGALQKLFSKQIKGFLLSTSKEILDGEEIQESLKFRASQMNTKIIHPNQFLDFKKELIKELKL